MASASDLVASGWVSDGSRDSWRVGIYWERNDTNTQSTITIYGYYQNADNAYNRYNYYGSGFSAKLGINTTGQYTSRVDAISIGNHYISAMGYYGVGENANWQILGQNPSYGSFTLTCTVNRGTSSQAYTAFCHGWVTYGDAQGYASADATITIPALASNSVVYNANGGSGTTASDTVYYGSYVTARASGFSRSGFSFVNWNDSQAGTGNAYTAGSGKVYYTGSTINLYAQWSEHTASWTFNSNISGATVSNMPSSLTSRYTSATSLPSNKPTISTANTAFRGWTTDSTANTHIYDYDETLPSYLKDPSTQIKSANSEPSATIWYAVWQTTYKPPEFTSNFNAARNTTTDTVIEANFAWSIWENASVIDPSVAGEHSLKIKFWAVGDTEPSETSSNTVYPSYDYSQDPHSGTVTNFTVNPSGFSFDRNTSYYLKAMILDSIGSAMTTPIITEQTIIVTTAYRTLGFRAGGKSIGIGCAAPDPSGHSNGLLEIAMDVELDNITIDEATVDKIRSTGAGSSWIAARDNATLRNTTNTSAGSFWPILSSKTTNGTWDIGSLGDNLYFSYATDANYNAGTNSTKTVVITSNGYIQGPNIYPVGAIYISYTSVSPASLFGGSWTQITDRVLRAANGNGTGGSDTHSHTEGDLRAAVGATRSNPSIIAYEASSLSSRGPSAVYAYQMIASGYYDSYGAYNHHTRVYGTTASASSLPAYQNLYVWRRTA